MEQQATAADPLVSARARRGWELLQSWNRLTAAQREAAVVLPVVCGLLVRHGFVGAWSLWLGTENRVGAVGAAGQGEKWLQAALRAERRLAEWLTGRQNGSGEVRPARELTAECPVDCFDFPGLVFFLGNDGPSAGLLALVEESVSAEEAECCRLLVSQCSLILEKAELQDRLGDLENQSRSHWAEVFGFLDGVQVLAYAADSRTDEILAVNRYGRQRYGPGVRGDLVGHRFGEILQGGPAEQARQDRSLVDLKVHHPVTGQWHRRIMAPVHWSDGRLARLEMVFDITAQQRVEEALLESEKSFRELVENSLVGILLIRHNKIIYQNPEQERLFGPLPPRFDLADFEHLHPDDQERVQELYARIVRGDLETVELDFRFYPFGRLNSRPDLKWVYCRARTIPYQGKKTLLVSMIDITRAKELEHLLRIQDKMSSLGRVTAGIAHEIRNPLSGINIYLSTLERLIEQPESRRKVREILGQLQAASDKIESVIRRVMDFAKPGEPRFVRTDLNRPVEAALGLAGVTLRRSGVTVEKELARDLPAAYLDPHLLEQVVLNLLNNAAEALKGTKSDKKIRLSTSREGQKLLLRVADSGPGVPVAQREKIFDPFYTTKADSTGIGLSLCHRIVHDHGGSLEVRASLWGGAELVLALPVEKRTRPRRPRSGEQ